MVRTALYEAAHIMLTRATRFSALKRWAMDVAKRRGMKRAKVGWPEARHRPPPHVVRCQSVPLGQGHYHRVKEEQGSEAGRHRCCFFRSRRWDEGLARSEYAV